VEFTTPHHLVLGLKKEYSPLGFHCLFKCNPYHLNLPFTYLISAEGNKPPLSDYLFTYCVIKWVSEWMGVERVGTGSAFSIVSAALNHTNRRK